MRLLRVFVVCVVLGATAGSCGGSGGESPTTPLPSTPPPAAPANPCDGIGIAAGDGFQGARVLPLRTGKVRGPALDRDPRYGVFDALWTHEAGRTRVEPWPFTPQGATEDVGEIAVIQDDGDIILLANAFDLAGKGLTFAPNGAGGFDVRGGDAAFQRELGTRLTLGDDDASNVPAAFNVSFFGQSYASAFVNSDGNITFGEADTASTERDVSRFLTGAPRLAVAFADLDPSAGGAVFVNATSDAFTVTWCNVPGFEDPKKLTAQAVVARDGTIGIKVASTTTRTDAIVGVSPGRTNIFRPADLTASASSSIGGGAGAVGERFSASDEVDLVALGRKFYQTHLDTYDQLVIWSDRRVITDAFAYEITVANEIRGIGTDIFDSSRTFGSSGRLRSVVMMDSIAKYPANPQEAFLGENTTLSLIGQEAGHRWLAFLNIRDANGALSNVLLGRDDAHWSFFTDSDASVMEGNDIEALGGGTFRTVGAVNRFSALDQYAMGLRSEADVPSFFYVENPVNVQPPQQSDSAPRLDVTFSGTRRDVLIQDIVAAMGPREPSAAVSPRVHAQAFIHLVSAGRQTDAANVAKIDRFRREWETFFLRATDERMRAETRLRQ
jgi:hypothetical protein